jgi:hypothetical protein
MFILYKTYKKYIFSYHFKKRVLTTISDKY